MCCGCDVKPENKLCGQPNPLTLTNGVPTRLPNLTKEALLIVVGNQSYDGGTLTVQKNGTLPVTLRGARGILIPCGGEWVVNWSGRADVGALLVESYCGAAFAAYVRKGPGRVLQSAPTMAPAASTMIVAANPFRRSLILCGLLTNTDAVWVSTGVAGAVGSGFPLAAGEKYAMDGEGCHPFVMNGFSTAGGGVTVVEGD